MTEKQVKSDGSQTQSLTSRDKGLIKECLLIVAKMQGVGTDQMKELIALHDKITE